MFLSVTRQEDEMRVKEEEFKKLVDEHDKVCKTKTSYDTGR